jgi:hypothetical protein
VEGLKIERTDCIDSHCIYIYIVHGGDFDVLAGIMSINRYF